MVLLTRKAEFSAAHYYYNEAWSQQENENVFGKCANRNGHGHNYTLEVTVAGEIDPVSGFVVDLKALKDVMEREVVQVYDHRHLNLEGPEFRSTIPTTENIAIAIWKRLEGKQRHLITVRFVDRASQVAHLMHCIRVGKQQPLSPRLLRRKPQRVRLPCPTCHRRGRFKHRYAGKLRGDFTRRVRRCVFHNHQLPVAPQQKVFLALPRQ